MAVAAEEKVFLLPDLGEGLTEAELVNWLVAVGDTIRVDQPIAEVETAKSTVEVPSPFEGTVAVLHGAAGDVVGVGKPLITVAVPAVPAPPVVAPAPPVVEPVETQAPAKGSGNVLIGYGTSGHGAAKRTRPPKQPVRWVPRSELPAPKASVTVISPLVRKLAHDGGLPVSAIHGTGPGGMVMRADVEAALAGAPSADSAARVRPPAQTDVRRGVSAGGEQAAAPAADVDAKTGLPIASRTPLKGVRRTVAANMSRSRTEIPEATVWVDVDATALVELRASLKRQDADAAPGLLAFVARFVLAGLAKYPALNTRIETAPDGSQEIVEFDGVNLGFAAQTDRGLMVPSIRGADKLSARALDAQIRRLTDVVREGKASPAELTSGTFTLNNYGVFGVDGSAAIINYPEAAILGIGRIVPKPWVVDGALAVRQVTELTLVFDHRVCDGGTAAGFLRYVADAIENPGSVLADL
jgi:2-oxoisovalerate dehydrogenase E2 component (dihydrolipoyl transacylase)